tara:strand:+ start:178 stop:351 length:174 start_codon:yes stop_codon:yes gene_type:complete
MTKLEELKAAVEATAYAYDAAYAAAYGAWAAAYVAANVANAAYIAELKKTQKENSDD